MVCAVASILIVEDDPKTAAAIADGLQRDGHVTRIAGNGTMGNEILSQSAFDAVILDWMLPGLTGIEVLSRVRARADRIPVLLLTARDQIEDRVAGLDQGADDYLVKPFALAELSARVRSLIRRAESQEPALREVGDLTLDVQRRVARRAGTEIPLTPREFDVLHCLMRHQGQVVTRAMLAESVWRDVPRATPLDNVIDVHLAHLRRKIDDRHPVKLLRTIRGVGLLICAP
jgi:two-component system, OmpR family, copper resistance phosphate regulon response regulator CusR